MKDQGQYPDDIGACVELPVGAGISSRAARNIARSVQEGKLDPDQIDEKHFQEYLATVNTRPGIYDPNLPGDKGPAIFYATNWLCRIVFHHRSLADFRKEHLYQAIVAYQQRERRFGMISETVSISV